MNRNFFLKSSKFPILEGEEEEIVNPGLYGKALAIYLETNLKQKGYDIPFYCCEDWGWWVEVPSPDKSLGVGCVRHPEEGKEEYFSCLVFPPEDRVWSWRRFRKIDISTSLDKLAQTIHEILSDDPEINLVQQEEWG